MKRYALDFSKCKDFDDLCSLLNLCGLEYSGDETGDNWEALQPYLGKEIEPMKLDIDSSGVPGL